MPSELQCAFRELMCVIKVALFEVGMTDQTSETSKRLYQTVEELLISILVVIEFDEIEFDKVLKAVTDAEVAILKMIELDLKSKIKKVGKPIEIIRKAIGRMYVIQKTSYIAACYSLMDAMVLIILTLMATTYWPRESAAGTAMAFTVIITFLFAFLWLFIRALEDPFEYPEEHNLKSYAYSRRIQMGTLDEIRYGGSIDMSTLFVDFGEQLRETIYGKGADGSAIYQNILNRINELRPKKNDHDKSALGSKAERRENEPQSPKDREWLRRWYLVARSLPWVFVMVVLRLAVWYGAGVGGWLNPRIFLAFISLTVFVVMLLLQGLIQDYKEAERVPSELLGAFQGLQNVVLSVSNAKPEFPRESALQCVLAMLLAVVSVADNATAGDTPADLCVARASGCVREAERRLLADFIRAQAFDHIAGLRPIETVRQALGRMQVIGKTRYILAGYSLADTMIGIVMALMALTDWPRDTQWYIAASYTTVVTFLFAYMFHLIRMVEDPFTYPEGHNRACLAEFREPDTPLAQEVLQSSIDLHILTVCFGKHLSTALPAWKESMAKLEADGPAACEAAPIKARGGDGEAVEPETPLHHFSLQYVARRWRIAVWALPFVAGLVGCRLAVWYGGGVGG